MQLFGRRLSAQFLSWHMAARFTVYLPVWRAMNLVIFVKVKEGTLFALRLFKCRFYECEGFRLPSEAGGNMQHVLVAFLLFGHQTEVREFLQEWGPVVMKNNCYQMVLQSLILLGTVQQPPMRSPLNVGTKWLWPI